MHGTYLFAQNEKGLYMIDQHAAQERIKYEQFKVEIGQVGRVSPTIDGANFARVLEEGQRDVGRALPLVEEFGIEMEPFGQNTFQIQSHPAWIKKGQEKAIIEEIIDFILADEKDTVAKLREATAIMMSCKGSIKANHHLT